MRIIFTLFTLFLLRIAAAQTAQFPENFSLGELDSLSFTYRNSFFNFEVQIPEGYYIQNKEEVSKMQKRGKKLMTKELKELFEESEGQMVTFLSAFKFPPSRANGVNSNFTILCEYVKDADYITPAMYLEQVGRLLEQQTRLKYKCKGKIVKYKPLSGNYYTLKTNCSAGKIKFHQDFIIKVEQGFVFGFLLTYKDKTTMEEIYNILKTVKSLN